jgi:hypothetical protein
MSDHLNCVNETWNTHTKVSKVTYTRFRRAQLACCWMLAKSITATLVRCSWFESDENTMFLLEYECPLLCFVGFHSRFVMLFSVCKKSLWRLRSFRRLHNDAIGLNKGGEDVGKTFAIVFCHRFQIFRLFQTQPSTTNIMPPACPLHSHFACARIEYRYSGPKLTVCTRYYVRESRRSVSHDGDANVNADTGVLQVVPHWLHYWLLSSKLSSSPGFETRTGSWMMLVWIHPKW